MPEIRVHLGDLRRRRGISAIRLAAAVGVSRQTIHAMEAGTYIPNTAVALRLARALESTVGELFTLSDDAAADRPRAAAATLLPGSPDDLQTGQAVQLCRVNHHLMASVPSPVAWYFPATDAVLSEKPAPAAAKVRVGVFNPDADFKNRILVAGCDPAISVLSRHVQAAGSELVLAHKNSSQALALLKEGQIHVAGTHLVDTATGESNLPAISRLFPRNSVAVVSFATWDQGIVTAQGNPKNIHGIADFARSGISIVNREPGAGSRLLLDTQLLRLGIPAKQVRGYSDLAPGHLPAAWRVLAGYADSCIATRAAARIFGLGFIPLASERYDLVVRKRHLDLPGVQTLFNTLNRLDFRRELEGLGGYDTGVTGARAL